MHQDLIFIAVIDIHIINKYSVYFKSNRNKKEKNIICIIVVLKY